MTTEATTHALLDVIIDLPLSKFVSQLWEDKQFVTTFLLNVQQVKELEITPWELECNDDSKYHRTITAFHKIPGFTWLPWLPLYIHSKKKEVISYSSQQRELTISEFSKVEGLPWHDIDCNLTWKVHNIGGDSPQGRVHVVVTAQVIFLTPSFIQSFAESTAVTEMISYLTNWHTDVKRSLVDTQSTVIPLGIDQNGALSKITQSIVEDIISNNNNKPIHRRQVFRVPASPTAKKTPISSSSSDISSNSVYSAVYSTAATISGSEANSAAATVGTTGSMISRDTNARTHSSSGGEGDSSSSVMRRSSATIENSNPSMFAAVQRFAYSSIWKVGENILYWSDAESTNNDKNFVFDCHNKSSF